jgi:hypothetical protein
MPRVSISRWTAAIVLMVSAGGLAGCVSAPVQEMSNARQAIKAARDAGAERIAPQVLSEAQTLLQQAESSLQKRAYRQARRDAIAAHHKAAEALDSVQPRPSQLQPNSTDSLGTTAGEDESVLAAR